MSDSFMSDVGLFSVTKRSHPLHLHRKGDISFPIVKPHTKKAMPPEPESLQLRTLRAFTVLGHLRQDWPGTLILSCGLHPQGAAVAFAANIAGAVCLCLEEDPEIARQALRTGACDFVVNTLDEALRAMKNEIRKHRPLAVGLQGNQSAVLSDLLERGVAPALVTGLSENPTHLDALLAFKSQGTTILHFGDHPAPIGSADAAALLAKVLNLRHWAAHEFQLANSAELRSFDSTAANLIPEDNPLRRVWLTSASRLFTRERPPRRFLWLTASERNLLQQKLQIGDAHQ